MTTACADKLCYACGGYWTEDRMLRLRKKSPSVGLCRACHALRVEKSHQKRLEKVGRDHARGSTYTGTRSAKDPEASKRLRELTYGLEVGGFDRLLEAQGHRCAICLRKPKKTLHVDHCHKSLKVRGLLCHQCNVAIGLFAENVDSLVRAADYLRAAS